MKRIKRTAYLLAALLTLVDMAWIFIFWHPFVANAQESISDNTIVPDEITPNISVPVIETSSSGSDERLNYLEIRMAEMDISISELRDSLELLQTSAEETEQSQIELSDKLDLIVIALDNIINYNIEYLDMYENQQSAYLDFEDNLSDYLTKNTDVLYSISENTLSQVDLSVSGNSLSGDLNDMFKTNAMESQKNIEDNMATYVETSTEHTAYILIFIGIAVGAIFGLILSGYIKKGS